MPTVDCCCNRQYWPDGVASLGAGSTVKGNVAFFFGHVGVFTDIIGSLWTMSE